LPSRRCSGRELAEAETWWNGPKFLKESKDQWPVDPQPTSKDNDEAYNEVMKNPHPIVHSLSGISLNGSVHIERILDPQRYSTKTKLLNLLLFLLLLLQHLYTR
jgi:hypothetical protein